MKLLILCTLLLLSPSFSYAVPFLQVGVPDGSGAYVLNTSFSSDPTETETAITSGNTIAVAARYENETVYVGGQYSDGTLTGQDWSYFGRPFDGYGAILVVSVAEGFGAAAYSSLQVGGDFAISWDETQNYFKNSHAPLKSDVSDFLFFDVGSFDNSGKVPNFQEPGDPADGQVKLFTISGTEGLDWIHFDLMALFSEYDEKSGYLKTLFLDTDDKYSANSKDVTWKNPSPVPEPSTLMLLGFGLIAFALYRRKQDIAD